MLEALQETPLFEHIFVCSYTYVYANIYIYTRIITYIPYIFEEYIILRLYQVLASFHGSLRIRIFMDGLKKS